MRVQTEYILDTAYRASNKKRMKMDWSIRNVVEEVQGSVI